MRWLVNYIRQIFCKHDFVFDEGWAEKTSDSGSFRKGIKVSCYCKKCSYHKSWWKY
jgi:hypothetical protein|nr:MAG TPA: Tat pathway signal sequence domain family protein [Caudoviricetes sp.]